MLTSKKTLLLLIPIYAIIAIAIVHTFSRNEIVLTAPESIEISISSENESDTSKTIAFIPSKITFNRLDHEIEVIGGLYNYENDTWSLTNDHAHLMVDDSIPSNIHIIYGHNAANVFAPVYSLQPGDIVTLTDDSNITVDYVFDRFESVSPTNTTILSNQDKTDTLILLTCEGTWNSTRRLAYLRLIEN